jgi:hypothetical protein
MIVEGAASESCSAEATVTGVGAALPLVIVRDPVITTSGSAGVADPVVEAGDAVVDWAAAASAWANAGAAIAVARAIADVAVRKMGVMEFGMKLPPLF